MKRLLILISLYATPAVAGDGCSDIWFTRNLLFDRAGYCFGSPLGQAVFDNSDCIGKNITLDPATKQIVSRIKALEKQHGCRVDTNRTVMDMDDVEIRRILVDHPIPDEFESACMGWRAAPLPLRAGHSAAAPVIGQITAGDFVSFAHNPVGDWTYVAVYENGWSWLKTGGWFPYAMINEASCAEWAG